MKCPACGSMDSHENFELIKAQSGDWGMRGNCYFIIRLEVLCPDCKGKDKLPKNPDGFSIYSRCGGGLLEKEILKRIENKRNIEKLYQERD
jgi:hypothetical protein